MLCGCSMRVIVATLPITFVTSHCYVIVNVYLSILLTSSTSPMLIVSTAMNIVHTTNTVTMKIDETDLQLNYCLTCCYCILYCYR